ncbi:hypothetical protein GUJ93_ZPchr0002g24880 [Zizania palustris]|uniref:Uncharacterized protein n=1 Tax=Zizania palustris TaxID=103762 RepID=A0A8J5RTE4_ZIZPA|nr:hypothetical protein GUJ93_ZPchr0002g24880 [Zizania palustris]
MSCLAAVLPSSSDVLVRPDNRKGRNVRIGRSSEILHGAAAHCQGWRSGIRRNRELQRKLETANKKTAKLATENNNLTKAIDTKDALISELK